MAFSFLNKCYKDKKGFKKKKSKSSSISFFYISRHDFQVSNHKSLEEHVKHRHVLVALFEAKVAVMAEHDLSRKA